MKHLLRAFWMPSENIIAVMVAVALCWVLAGCAAVPNPETGDGCWKFGVLENGNTGQMHPDEPRVVKLGFDEVQKACGAKLDEPVRGCYTPVLNTIYLYRLDGDIVYLHEFCHWKLGREHNNCYPHYGIGKDESACDWNKE